MNKPEHKQIAVLPARGGSKRIPRKNIVDICGRPLLSYPIETCHSAGIFSEIIVSTDDEEIADVAREWGATADMRPPQLAEDRVPAAQVCAELLERKFAPEDRPETFCLVYPMAAFMSAEDLIESARTLEGQDAVLGVSHYPLHPYKALVARNGHLHPLWPEENKRQSQTYPEAFAANGSFCWVRTEPFLKALSFYPSRLAGHVMPPDRAVDIDTPDDLARARQLMRLRQLAEAGEDHLP
ncbi:acylneuraminate cytidylyltransferase family protein [Ruegeria sp. ANG-S4]|uniref:acylneuraminate cytidylyltransferase family protein n=1 Tax=Ruegeria sp. ANG-S4 TaxID=1577904 RepID=UPI00068FAE30|nr:acylneuraminate cytidylyltransferase family protein [Ruegeria sp. ANG-S4]